MTKRLGPLCLLLACALTACDGGSNTSTAPTSPTIGEIHCKSGQNIIGNTTTTTVTVDCGDATAEPFVVPAE